MDRTKWTKAVHGIYAHLAVGDLGIADTPYEDLSEDQLAVLEGAVDEYLPFHFADEEAVEAGEDDTVEEVKEVEAEVEAELETTAVVVESDQSEVDADGVAVVVEEDDDEDEADLEPVVE